MILLCSKCLTAHGRERAFTSNNPDTAIAWKDVYVAIVQHYNSRHPKTADRVNEKISKLLMLVEGYVRISEFAEIPEDQDELLDQMEEMEDAIMEAIGYETEEEPDEGAEGADIVDKTAKIDTIAIIDSVDSEDMA
jgi:hypothetical protein